MKLHQFYSVVIPEADDCSVLDCDVGGFARVHVLEQLADVLWPNARPDLQLQDHAVSDLHVDPTNVHLKYIRHQEVVHAHVMERQLLGP